MLFCPKCGSLLRTRQEGSKKIMACGCGYVQRAEGTVQTDKKEVHDDIQIVDDKEEMLPLTDAECPKCKHRKAYFWTVQTRAGDEAETKFMKCEKCNHTWREYD